METNILRTTWNSRSKALGNPFKKGDCNNFLDEHASLLARRENFAKRMFKEARQCNTFEQLRDLEDYSRIDSVLRRSLIQCMETGDTTPSRFLRGHSDAVAERNLCSFFISPDQEGFQFNELDLKPTMQSHFDQGM
jgi:hypothetical protein